MKTNNGITLRECLDNDIIKKLTIKQVGGLLNELELNTKLDSELTCDEVNRIAEFITSMCDASDELPLWIRVLKCGGFVYAFARG